MTLSFKTVGVIGAGTMGAGIAQVAAQAGCTVKLFETRTTAQATTAIGRTSDTLNALVTKGRQTAEAAAGTISRLHAAIDLADFHDCDLVVEAIVEDLGAKQALFKSLESICGESTILGTNTSSISITAIANGLARPQNVVGMHFFDPRR